MLKLQNELKVIKISKYYIVKLLNKYLMNKYNIYYKNYKTIF